MILGVGAISWFPRVQKFAAAATSESEYVALAEVALAETVNELRSLRQVKEFMAPPIDIDIKIHEDDGGAIKRATNRFSSRWTRHVDVKHHIVRDAIDEGGSSGRVCKVRGTARRRPYEGAGLESSREAC